MTATYQEGVVKRQIGRTNKRRPAEFIALHFFPR